MGADKMINRIAAKAGFPEIMDSLVNKIGFTDLKSLMMEVYSQKVRRLGCSDVLRQYGSSKFVKPSNVSALKMHELDSIAYSLLPPSYKVIEPSPLSPLGSCSALAPVNQNSIVSAVNNTEVCSDITNVMALEAASNRQFILADNKLSDERVRLCASHRLVRTQPFDDPNSFAHFKLFSLCAAGRDTGHFDFEYETMVEHIDFYFRLFDKLAASGYKIKSIGAELIIYHRTHDELAGRVTAYLNNKSYRTAVSLSTARKENQNYYTGLGYHLYVEKEPSEMIFLVDGGITDWTQKLLNNKKERFLISGMGSERLVHCFS